MIAIIQRVNNATIYADEEFSGKNGKGLYILLGVIKGDEKKDAELISEKIAKCRIFKDENDKMNLSCQDVGGEVMIVSNFTLGANYKHGNRPDYFASASPNEANELYEYFITLMKSKVVNVATGKFGSDMRTEMSTDGPVTIVFDSEVLKGNKK